MDCPVCGTTNLKIPDDAPEGYVGTCPNCKNQIQMLQSGRKINRGERTRGGTKQLILGIIIMVISALVSIFGSIGSIGIIFYGAIIFGFILFIKGVINLSRAGISKARYRD